eukprot:SAG11_NODE_25403_length_359_cov_0.792308_1_plen_45_part_01
MHCDAMMCCRWDYCHPAYLDMFDCMRRQVRPPPPVSSPIEFSYES